jgi:hypothetical protein
MMQVFLLKSARAHGKFFKMCTNTRYLNTFQYSFADAAFYNIQYDNSH